MAQAVLQFRQCHARGDREEKVIAGKLTADFLEHIGHLAGFDRQQEHVGGFQHLKI